MKINSPNIIPYTQDDIDDQHTQDVNKASISNLNTNIEPPYQICLSPDPIDNILQTEIMTKGSHATLGLELKHNEKLGNRLQLIQCLKSTPSARIPKWRSTLRNSFLVAINDIHVTSEGDVKEIIAMARERKDKTITCKFATVEKVGLHPQEGIPLMYHDQMNIIAKHIAEIKLNKEEQNEMHQQYLETIQPTLAPLKSAKKKAKLTRKILKTQEDWHQWETAEHKQLQQYHEQGMFSEPQHIPSDANCLPFMWTYVLKDDGTRKARAPCNGSPRMQGTVTLGETYAASLDQTASKIFWSISATTGHIVIGADASNAFAEAPAPLAPLYMKLDTQFHSWWKSKG